MKREKRVFHYAEIVDHMMAQKAPYEKDKPKYKKVLEIMHSLVSHSGPLFEQKHL